jgi:hypothetical protein
VRITRKTDNLGFVVQLDRRVFFDALNEVGYLCLRYVVSPMSPGRTQVKLAGATGLEPATSCVTSRRSKQLNYAPQTD